MAMTALIRGNRGINSNVEMPVDNLVDEYANPAKQVILYRIE